MATATVPTAQSVSRWLEPGVVRMLALVSAYAIPVAVGTHWPLATTGNALQVLGACWASLGVPVASEGLAWLERATERWWRAAKISATKRRAALKAWWDRRRGRIHTSPANLEGMSSATAGMSADLTVTSADRATMSELARIEILEADVQAHADRLTAIENAQAEDRERWNRELAEQAQELRAHTIAVTRRGWEFILGGLLCSGVGAFLALLA